jgi:hypothetical protein
VYDRKNILDSISLHLNKINRIYLLDSSRIFSVQDERSYNFFICDLVDTLNYTPNSKEKKIRFVNHHIYHIASLRTMFKISSIFILSNGKLIFFDGLNCIKKINNVNNVLDWFELNSIYKNDVNLKLRIKNYKLYHQSMVMCAIGSTPICECE